MPKDLTAHPSMESHAQNIATLGAWLPNADRLVPRGNVQWASGPLGFAGTVAGKPTASVRKSGRQWLARIEGWQWHVTSDMGVARLNQIPGDKIQMTPVKAFSTAKSAKDEVQSILSPESNSPETKEKNNAPLW